MVSYINYMFSNWRTSVARLHPRNIGTFWQLSREALQCARGQIKYALALFVLYGIATLLLLKGGGFEMTSVYFKGVQAFLAAFISLGVTFWVYFSATSYHKEYEKGYRGIFIVMLNVLTLVLFIYNLASYSGFTSSADTFHPSQITFELVRTWLPYTIIYGSVYIAAHFIALAAALFTTIYMLDHVSSLYKTHNQPSLLSTIALFARGLRHSLSVVLLELPCLVLGSLLLFIFFMLSFIAPFLIIGLCIALIGGLLVAVLGALGFITAESSADSVGIVLLPLLFVFVVSMVLALVFIGMYLANIYPVILYHLYRSRNPQPVVGGVHQNQINVH